MDFAIDTDIAYHSLLFQELEVSAFSVVFVLIITLSRTDYQCQVIKVAASALTHVYSFLFAPTHAQFRLSNALLSLQCKAMAPEAVSGSFSSLRKLKYGGCWWLHTSSLSRASGKVTVKHGIRDVEYTKIIQLHIFCQADPESSGRNAKVKLVDECFWAILSLTAGKQKCCWIRIFFIRPPSLCFAFLHMESC